MEVRAEPQASTISFYVGLASLLATPIVFFFALILQSGIIALVFLYLPALTAAAALIVGVIGLLQTRPRGSRLSLGVAFSLAALSILALARFGVLD